MCVKLGSYTQTLIIAHLTNNSLHFKSYSKVNFYVLENSPADSILSLNQVHIYYKF